MSSGPRPVRMGSRSQAHVDPPAVADIERSKTPYEARSGGFPVVEVQRAAESLPTSHPTLKPAGSGVSENQLAVQPLVMALAVVVADEGRQCATKMALAERHDSTHRQGGRPLAGKTDPAPEKTTGPLAHIRRSRV